MVEMSDGKTLAIIIPVYNESDALEANFNEILSTMDDKGISANYLIVDDGSKDNTWEIIKKISGRFSNVSGITFARNFGKELALRAGIDVIDADMYLFMDSDLQHPPQVIPLLLDEMYKTNADIVEGVKASRGKESLKYKVVARSFYKILKSITQLDLDNSSDFKLMTREVIESIREFEERNVFFRGIVSWVGFETVQLPFEVEERKLGTSHFSAFRLMRLALDAVLSYTSKPLYVTIVSGVLFLLFAVILGVQTLYNYISGMAVDGFSTVILLVLITGSMLMISLGVIGVYISRIYDEVKKRPQYVVQRRVGGDLK